MPPTARRSCSPIAARPRSPTPGATNCRPSACTEDRCAERGLRVYEFPDTRVCPPKAQGTARVSFLGRAPSVRLGLVVAGELCRRGAEAKTYAALAGGRASTE